MRKLFTVLAILTMLATPAFAGKLTVNSTSHGQFDDLKILGAESSAVSGNEATIDLRELMQSSTTGAAVVLTLDQDDVDESLIDFQCQATDATDSCSHHITTGAAKAGAIKVDLNGSEKWIWIYEDSD
jgi:hypothetical protein